MSYQSPSAPQKPTAAFVGASWAVLILGVVSFAVGLWNSDMTRSEVGFYAATMLLGLFGALSVQKSVRDRAEGIPVTSLYLGVAALVVGLSVLMMTIGLWNSGLALSERGFYGLAFAMSMFAVVAVQKNVRDSAEPAMAPPLGAQPMAVQPMGAPAAPGPYQVGR